MRCFAQIRDADGHILVRWEDEVAGDGDVKLLVGATIDLFRREYPARPLMTDEEDPALLVEWGMVRA
jgi:hypothetical protein